MKKGNFSVALCSKGFNLWGLLSQKLFIIANFKHFDQSTPYDGSLFENTTPCIRS